jgi:hypothetical protein
VVAAHSGSATMWLAVNMEKGARCCFARPAAIKITLLLHEHCVRSLPAPSLSCGFAAVSVARKSCYRDRVGEDAVASRLLLRALAHASGLQDDSQALSSTLRDDTEDLQVPKRACRLRKLQCAHRQSVQV